MNLVEATSDKLIFLNQTFTSKEEIFQYVTKQLFLQGKVTNESDFLEALYEREAISVTGFENGLAIPHGKSKAVIEPSFAVITLERPLKNYASLDPNNQVDLIFLLAIPQSEANSTHLELLSQLSTKLADPKYVEEFKKVQNKSQVLQLLDQKKITSVDKSEVVTDKGLILGVTACAAGIAHTYMAAEALKKAAGRKGYHVKIEKQGANGIEDKINQKDIQQAIGIILAHDVSLKDTERFKRLPKIDTTVAAPLKNADGLISDLINKSTQQSREETTNKVEIDELLPDKKKITHEIKDSVLTGISYIIPVIIAGGMISTVAVLLTQMFGLQELLADETSWLFLLKGLGNGLLGTLMIPLLAGYMSYAIADKPGLTPGLAGGLAAMTINSGFLGAMLAGLIAGFLMKGMKENIKPKGIFAGFVSFWVYPVIGSLLVGCIMLFIVGKPVAALNEGMIHWLDTLQGSSAILLGAVLGIMVSFDLGGPVNKAAYAFCIGAMSNGNFIPYCTFASVKMVSAFSVSAACLLRKDIFSKEEREIGNQTWLLGLAGITEGAIPFAMSDPIRVIGSFLAGSMVTGAIVTYFGIGLSVPGAGIFSMFLLEGSESVVSKSIIWLGAAIFGAAISTVLLIITREAKLRKLQYKEQ